MLLIDEIAGAKAREVGPAETTKLTISVRELIQMRVELEWRAAQDRDQGVKSIVSARRGGPGEGSVEQALNSKAGASLGLFGDSALDQSAKIERLFKTAIEAFETQRLFVLLDDKQAQDLDEEVDVARTATATFLLLTPLQGG